LKDQG